MKYQRGLTDFDKQLILNLDETEFQNKIVVPMAIANGWRVAHTSDSRRIVTGTDGAPKAIGDKQIKGYPDLTLAHPTVGIVIAELKRETGWHWRPGQREWLDTIAMVAAAQDDWAIAVEARTDLAGLLGPMPRVYAALWRPGDIDDLEAVLERHRTDTATWWPNHRRGSK